jgi:TRAP-type transport system periplasmic protein
MNINLKLAIHMEPEKPTWLAYERWVKRLGDMSNGTIKVNISYSGIIGIEEWNRLKSGHADMARVFTMNMDPFPLHTVPALPYLMPIGDENLSVLNSLYDKYLHDEWKEVKVLWLGLMSPYQLHTTKKAVLVPEDFRGLRIQASGLVAELVKTWGGIPVSLVLPDSGLASRQDIADAMYSALKTRSVDGVVSTFEVTKDFKLYEVTKFHTCLNTVRDVNATIMNLDTWKSLPPDIQKIFEDLNPWAQKELDAAQKAESAEAEDLLKQYGHSVLELSQEALSSWIMMSRPLIEEKVDYLESQGVRARAIAEELNTLLKP